MKGTYMVIGYCRISTLSQVGNTSLDFQSSKISEYCELYDLPLTKIYHEQESGGNDDRVVLSEIKTLIKSNQISILLINKIDRLGRNMIGSLTFIELCKEHNVDVISITDGIDTRQPQSNLLLNLLLVIATEEKVVITNRCKSGRDTLWKQDKLPHGKLPLGYIRNKGGSVVVDENVQPIIQYIYKKFNQLSKMKHLSKTKRTQRLLKLLRNKGYKYYGKEFRWWNIKSILRHPLYSGQLKYKDETKVSPFPTMVSKRLFNQVQLVI